MHEQLVVAVQDRDRPMIKIWRAAKPFSVGTFHLSGVSLMRKQQLRARPNEAGSILTFGNLATFIMATLTIYSTFMVFSMF